MSLNPQELYEEFSAYVDSRPKISTHCHQLPDQELRPFTLDTLFRNSYVNWCGVSWDGSIRSREIFLEKVRYNSFFVWLQKSLLHLYGENTLLTASSWPDWNERLQLAHQDPLYSRTILTRQCGYLHMLLDAYWDPGSDNNSPDFFAPAYRVNAFFFGYSTNAADHDGNNPYTLSPHSFISNLDEYIGWVRDNLLAHRAGGCVTLKIPIAYDRGLDFEPVSDDQARQAFARLTAASAHQPDNTSRGGRGPALPSNVPAHTTPLQDQSIDPVDVKAFQDYLFFQLCQMAADLDLPVQIHTGMGQGRRTNAAALQPAIRNFPATRFVLLHCSYPWIQDMSMLVDKYPNVYPDLSMLPLISTQSGATMLHELIERATLDRIFWGCDTWTAEESYGALLAFRHVLALTLAEKVLAGYFTRADALLIIDAILFKNPQRFYKLASAG
ncbi:MAG TPA: amidohydrolase family protein [Anaerolineales bacterium]|nr:amidohydrolase family protein [Anaerolineales bacterium]